MGEEHCNYDDSSLCETRIDQMIEPKIQDIMDTIEIMIETNNVKDEFGNPIGYQYSEETIAKFEEAFKLLTILEKMAIRIDRIVSGYDNEEAFNRKWNEKVLNKIIDTERR